MTKLHLVTSAFHFGDAVQRRGSETIYFVTHIAVKRGGLLLAMAQDGTYKMLREKELVKLGWRN